MQPKILEYFQYFENVEFTTEKKTHFYEYGESSIDFIDKFEKILKNNLIEFEILDIKLELQ